jgi:Ca2+-binding EF-hand superfamily protein
MKSRQYYLFIVLFALVLSTLFALPDGYAVHELFKNIDENSDGKITPREFSEDMKEHTFQKLDADDDKMIEKEEWLGYESISDREKHVDLFERMDKDKDKRISFFEFSDYADKKSNIEEAFIGLDKDGNNSLSPDEITVRPLFKMITIRFR